MRAGCAIDGIEILALYTWKKTSFTITEIILGINILIFGIAAFRFGIEVALYSMLTYFTATKTVDYVVEGLEAYVGVTIISGKSEIIKDRLVNEMGRGKLIQDHLFLRVPSKKLPAELLSAGIFISNRNFFIILRFAALHNSA
jgi:uncharacterized membrane-anchored protein YitT (DUF2179 family)